MSRLLLFLVAMAIPACASDRYLTKEQDAKMKEICEAKENEGCAVIPGNLYRAIQQLFSGVGI